MEEENIEELFNKMPWHSFEELDLFLRTIPFKDLKVRSDLKSTLYYYSKDCKLNSF